MDRREFHPIGLGERTAAIRPSGFTLAELLVVMAIIAILTGILLPVLMQARDTAKMRTCSQNLKELAQVFAMYLDDNNGYALPSRTIDRTLNPAPLIRYTKEPSVKLVYLSDGTFNPRQPNPKRIWVCPGDRSVGEDAPRWCYNQISTSSYWYAYDAFLASSNHTDVYSGRTAMNTPRRPEQWARPTRDVIFCDYASSFHRGTKSGTGSDNAVKCVNFVMLDGHVITGTRADLKERLWAYVLMYDNPYSLSYSPGFSF